MEPTATDAPIAGVPDLVGALDELDLRLLDPPVEEARGALRSLVAGYLFPRAEAPDGPLVVAVVGESGSGKSTIVNGLARHRIVPTGSLRPTTRRPAVWAAEPLPGTLGDLRGVDGLDVVTEGDGPPEGIIVVDTPPPSVRGPSGDPIVATLLDRADVCILVVSGLRYADAASWHLLRHAADRDLPIVVVLNRLPENPGIQEVVTDDLAKRMIREGVVDGGDRAPLVSVAEGPVVDTIGGLPPEWVAPVHKELESLADLATRRRVIRRVLSASRRRARRTLLDLRDALVDASLIQGALASDVEDAYGEETSGIAAIIAAGDLAELATDPEAMATDLAAVVARRANRAARRTADAWDRRRAGSAVLEGDPGLWTHGPDVFESAQERFTDWDRSLADLVLDTLGRRRMGARRLERNVALVRREAVDPAFEPARPADLRRRRRLEDAPAVARRWLVRIARETLESDAGRFRDTLGPAPNGDLLRRMVLPEESGRD